MSWLKYVWIFILGLPYIIWIIASIVDTIHTAYILHSVKVSDYTKKIFEMQFHHLSFWDCLNGLTQAFWIVHGTLLFATISVISLLLWLFF